MSNTNQKYIVAKFDKVPFQAFSDSMKKNFPTYQWKENQLEELYEKLQLPKRSSKNASCYDFFAPYKIELTPGSSITIPTGIYMKADSPWMLLSTPLVNTDIITSILIEKIDTDELENDENNEISSTDNSGHVLIKLEKPNTTCLNNNVLSSISKFGKDLRYWNKSETFKESETFCRATLIPYGITLNDEWDEDSEHVDEIKVIDNFVWSEKLYPGSTDPHLDGKSVTVMIIDDGNTVTYKFSVTGIGDITEDDINDILNSEEVTDDDIGNILNC